MTTPIVMNQGQLEMPVQEGSRVTSSLNTHAGHKRAFTVGAFSDDQLSDLNNFPQLAGVVYVISANLNGNHENIATKIVDRLAGISDEYASNDIDWL
ncbi:hypothetical protein Ciccas_000685 [Cichlidogyrus casuarinus]|uniref:Uncharacterized protein n=1 Tax=Cichlidogyrus casuarinus TaxID=1844966 RepID=A0ABD2QM84_9PLAT